MTGVTISIDRQGISQHFEVKTDNRGQFLHAGLPTGQYRVAVMRDGKPAMTNDNVRVTFGGDAKADFDLKNARAAGGNSAEERKEARRRKGQGRCHQGFIRSRSRGPYRRRTMTKPFGCLRKSAEKDPTQHVIFANLADAYSQARKYDEAAESYKKAIELKPDEAAYYNNLGIVYGNAGKIDEATQNLQKAAELNPTGRGSELLQPGRRPDEQGPYKEAGDAFKKAIEFDPKMHNAYYQLGISYFGNPTTIPEAIPPCRHSCNLLQQCRRLRRRLNLPPTSKPRNS